MLGFPKTYMVAANAVVVLVFSIFSASLWYYDCLHRSLNANFCQISAYYYHHIALGFIAERFLVIKSDFKMCQKCFKCDRI